MGCSLTLSTVISTADRCTIMLSSQLTRQRCLTLRHGGLNTCHPLRSRLSVAKQTSSRLAAAAAPAEAAVPEGVPAGPDAIFHGLCNASGIDSDAVTIKRISRDKGTGLFAARDIAKGDTLLRWVGEGVAMSSSNRSSRSSNNNRSSMHRVALLDFFAAAAAAQCKPWHTPELVYSPGAHGGAGGGGVQMGGC